ncbi:MAG: hypothetical protein KGJ09_07535 [Candidatus Omnitrophica bacterium]|nr:hypothetical protein [Candidatus Omnitrophota bacterium]
MTSKEQETLTPKDPAIMKKPGLLLLAVLAAGIIIAAPYTNFQEYLSQGDHGRDLYAAQAVFRGELPYKDFWWVYGPLMPYYYGLFFKIFGTKISSMILGKLCLRIAGGILMALGLLEIASPLAAFIGACWFMFFQQDFFYTYNHIGGLVMILGVAWRLLAYIQKSSSKAPWSSLPFIFVLCLIKINFGLAALAVSVITVAVCDFVRRTPADRPKKSFYAAAVIGIPLVNFLIYWSLLHGLTIREIRQCLPYLPGDHPYNTTPWTAVCFFCTNTWHTITSTWSNLVFAVLINACALRCIYLIVKNKLPPARRMALLLSLGLLGLFYAANSHEFIASGVWYCQFWAQPLSIMIIFILIDAALQSIPKAFGYAVFSLIAVMLGISWFVFMVMVSAMKTKSHYLDLPRGGIYVTNSPSWITTVEQTTNYLNTTLKPGELFFALPYDCLYYYLTGKKSPTRQLIFFEHIKIPPAQEKSVIAELVKNRVNYVLLSNRAFAHQESGLGILGTNYCPLIAKYIEDNFTALVHFGDWKDEPGWAWNHGTCILKRKVPL